MKKIALLGSAPSSVQLAPFSDPSWLIMGCSPGAAPHAKRADIWLEIHSRTLDPAVLPQHYIDFMAKVPTLYVADEWPELPNAKPYPKDEMLDRFGPFFFTSTISWMFALAISMQPDEIGLWGIDMSADEEYIGQRQGCHYFISIARAMGIKITVPPQSDLLRPAPLYGFREIDPHYVKLMIRKGELTTHVANAEQEMAAARDKYWYFKGALADLEYELRTWIGDRKAVDLAYLNPSPSFGTVPAIAPKAESTRIDPPRPARKRKANGSHAIVEA